MEINLPKIIGHRGVKGLAPENTIISIEESFNHKLKWIEIDVKTSKDKIPFLLHDDLLDRTTTGKGYPYNYLYKEIMNFNAGTWFNKKFVDVYPPTLEEAIVCCENNKIGLNIELKPNKGKEKENVDAIYSLILKKKLNIQYFFSSFDYFSLELARNKMPNIALGYLMHDSKFINLIIQNCIKLKCFSIGMDIKIIEKSIIKKCKKNNLKIMVYSNENIEYNTALKLWSIGIDSIFIDNPLSYYKILNNSF